jgi:hypothetical protein
VVVTEQVPGQLELEFRDEIDILRDGLSEYWSEYTYGTTEDGFVFVDELEGDHRRWSSYNQVITRGPSGQHYMWGYEHGHTEYQENSRDDDKVIKVKPVVRLVPITDWVSDE